MKIIYSFFLFFYLFSTNIYADDSDILGLANGNNILFVDKNNIDCNDTYTRIQALSGSNPWCGFDGFLFEDATETKILSGDIVYFLNGTYNTENVKNLNIINGTLFDNITLTSYPTNEVIFSSYIESYTMIDNGLWQNISFNGMNIWNTTYNELDTSGPVAQFENLSTFVTVRCYGQGSECTLPGNEPYTHWLTREDRNFNSIWANDSSNEIRIRLRDINLNPNEVKIYISDEYNTLSIKNNIGPEKVIIENITFKYHRRGLRFQNSSDIIVKNNLFYGGKSGLENSGNDISGDDVCITNNILNGLWNFDENWIQELIKKAYIENDMIVSSKVNGSMYIYNNTIINAAGGISLSTESLKDSCGTQVRDNLMINGTGSYLEIEKYCCNSTWDNNIIIDSWMGVSWGPSQASYDSPCTFKNNLIYLSDYIIYNETVNYSTYASKSYTWVEGLLVSNWNISHNTFIAKEKGWYGLDSHENYTQQNLSVMNNIFYGTTASVQSLINRNGEDRFGNYFDYNIYWENPEPFGYLFYNYMNETSLTGYNSLAEARNSSDWDGQWDLHSVETDPIFISQDYYNALFCVPYANSNSCEMSDSSSHVGAKECSDNYFSTEGYDLENIDANGETINIMGTGNLVLNGDITNCNIGSTILNIKDGATLSVSKGNKIC